MLKPIRLRDNMELEGRARMIGFNCTEDKINDWKPIDAAILDSVKAGK